MTLFDDVDFAHRLFRFPVVEGAWLDAEMWLTLPPTSCLPDEERSSQGRRKLRRGRSNQKATRRSSDSFLLLFCFPSIPRLLDEFFLEITQLIFTRPSAQTGFEGSTSSPFVPALLPVSKRAG